MNIFKYKLVDILNFSGETYYRTIELYNEHMWPVYFVAALLLGFALLVNLVKPVSDRLTALILTIALIWTGYVFHYQYYSTINWLALIYAALFLFRAGLTAWSGVIHSSFANRSAGSASAWIGGLITFYAVVLHPVLCTLRDCGQHIELFGLHPTPTLIAFCGVLIWRKSGPVWPHLILPAVYFIIEGAIAWEIGAYEVLAGLVTVLLVGATRLLVTKQPVNL